MDVQAIFRERFARFTKEFIRYSQYMANGGMLFIFIFLSGLMSVYYRELIAAIPAWFPVPYALALVFALTAVRSPHRTFLLQADLLFLTHVEAQMERYFRKTRVYNFIVQSIFLALLLFLLLPVYRATTAITQKQLWLYWLMPLLLKCWNIQSSWTLLRLPDRRKLAAYSLARFVLTYLLLVWALTGGAFLSYAGVPFAMLLAIAGLVLLQIRLGRIRLEHPYQWYRLLEMENGLRRNFYRFVGQFTDVPWLNRHGKTRPWLSFLLRFVTYQQAHCARYLFLRMFLRSSEYAGVYTRLLLIGGLLVMMFPDLPAKLMSTVIILLMTGLQLKGLWERQRRGSWFQIFPMSEALRKRSFVWVCSLLLGCEGALISCFALFSDLGAALILALITGITAYIYCHLIMPRGLKS